MRVIQSGRPLDEDLPTLCQQMQLEQGHPAIPWYLHVLLKVLCLSVLPIGRVLLETMHKELIESREPTSTLGLRLLRQSTRLNLPKCKAPTHMYVT